MSDFFSDSEIGALDADDFFADAPPPEPPPKAEQYEISVPREQLDEHALDILGDPDVAAFANRDSDILIDFPWARRLTYPQTCLVLVYAGDITEASKLTGIPYETCRNWLKLPQMRYALRERLVHGVAPELIASRDERMAMWTRVFRDEAMPINDRLKASELLGKANCDFSEKRVLTGEGQSVRVVVDTGIPRPPGMDAIDVTPNETEED